MVTPAPTVLEAKLYPATGALAPLADAIGVEPEQLAGRVDDLGGRARIAIDAGVPETVADRAMARPELADTPGGPVTREQLLAMLAGASA